jgi:vacuolar protein sorting-associated protein 13A/C
MSLTRMSNIADSARFLDNVDLTFSLDSRSTSSQQLTSIEVGAKPIIFRASFHDISLIMNITNKALLVYGSTTNARAQKPGSGARSMGGTTTARSSGPTVTTRTAPHPIASAHVITSKEQVGVIDTSLWILLIHKLAQSNVRRAEGGAHRGRPRTANVALEGQTV